jgi:VIT1/CCC1 family predicted Fe2+/Mn2+ transporter
MGISLPEQKAEYLKDAVFAANDGIVTTFAVVAGSAGASLSSDIVLILGFANLFADGFSMASGNYLGVKSEIEYEKSDERVNHHHVSPIKQAMVTFISFGLAGFLPLTPYIFNIKYKFPFSIVIVIFVLFSIGILKARYAKRDLLRGALEMLFVGGFAAIVAYATGEALKKITG